MGDSGARRYSPEKATSERLAVHWTLFHETLAPGRRDTFDLLIDVLARSGRESDESGERAAASAQLEVIAREMGRLEEREPSGAPGPERAGGGSTDPIGPVLSRLLGAPRLVPVREVPLAPA